MQHSNSTVFSVLASLSVATARTLHSRTVRTMQRHCRPLTVVDPDIDAGVSIIGCPDVALLMRQRAGEKAEQLVPTSFLKTVDNLGATSDRVSRKDLLVLKGNEDPLVPWSASQDFINRLPQDKVTVKGYEKVGHAVTREMIDDTAAWILMIRQRVSKL